MIPRLLHPVLFVSLCVPLQAPAQEGGMTPEHVAKLRAVIQAQPSPSGEYIAYVLAVPRDLTKEKDGGSWTELHVLDKAGRSRPYVTGEVNVSSVAWKPDGQEITFLSRRDKDTDTNLYSIPLAGGEAKKILDHKTSISGYSWSPQGKHVAFLATEPKPKEKKDLEEKGFNQEIYEEDDPFVRVWIGEIGGESEPRKLELTGSASELHWSPEGSLLAVALAPLPLIDHELMYRKIHIVDVLTGKVRHNLNNPGKIGELAWSPDGKHVALISGEDKHDTREGQLWVASVEEGKWRNLLPGYDAHVQSVGWRDAQTVVYQSAESVWTAVGEVKLDGNRTVLVSPGGPILQSIRLSKDGKVVTAIGDSPSHPPEVYKLGTDSKPNRLTDNNPWLKDIPMGKQEVITYTARDGLMLQGVLIRPLNEQPGRRYPLVLSVHGGPEAHEPNGWLTSYSRLGQVGSANDFAVFSPNYRGSTGRGVAFAKLGQEDAAGREFDDLIDGVDHLIEIGLVDKAKVGITGGSYGGYATAWGSTYYSDRFAAGVMFVGISNNVSKVGTTDIPDEMLLVHHRKRLWEDWEYFLKRSPIYHIENAKTPLLILHGKEDPRVHPSQSLELHRHLKTRNKAPVRLVLYPGEGHGNRRAAARYDYNLRLLRWMTHFLKEGKKTAPPHEIEYKILEKK